MRLALSLIRLDGGTQRAEPSAKTLAAWVKSIRDGDDSDLTAEMLFDDITLVRDQEHKRSIERRCMADGGAIAGIDEHPQFGLVWHTLYRQDRVSKKGFAREFEKPRKRGPEFAMESNLCSALAAAGASPRRQVPCRYGIADVVTDNAVYEIKVRLDGSALFSAIGQVLLYRSAINPAARAVIVGRVSDDAIAAEPALRAAGVEVLFVEE